MRTRNKYKLSLITSLIVASMSVSVPAWASQGTTTSNNIISNNTGASAGEGDYNTAVGVGVVIGDGIVIGDLIPIDEDNNGHFGYQSEAKGRDNRAIGAGAVAVGNNNTAIGAGSRAIGNDKTALGSGAVAIGGGSVALGAGSIAYEPNTASVGSYGNERRITNVAPGIYDTDAVNMSQLRNTDNKINRVGATAFAFSALAPLSYDPKEPTQYSAGIGTYNGTSAVAIGIYHYTKSDVMLNAAIGMSNDGWEKSARFGISWRTGGPKHKELTPAIPVTPKENIVEHVKKILDDAEKAE